MQVSSLITRISDVAGFASAAQIEMTACAATAILAAGDQTKAERAALAEDIRVAAVVGLDLDPAKKTAGRDYATLGRALAKHITSAGALILGSETEDDAVALVIAEARTLPGSPNTIRGLQTALGLRKAPKEPAAKLSAFARAVRTLEKAVDAGEQATDAEATALMAQLVRVVGFEPARDYLESRVESMKEEQARAIANTEAAAEAAKAAVAAKALVLAEMKARFEARRAA